MALWFAVSLSWWLEVALAGSRLGWVSAEPFLGIVCTDATGFIIPCAFVQECDCKSCLQKQAGAVCKPSRLGLCLNLCD